MSSVYTRAETETVDLMEEIKNENHVDLVNAGVAIGVLVLDSEAGLSVHGYPAIAAVKITGLKERTLGVEDAVIVLDRVRWEALTDDERRAVLDHELEHISVVRDNQGDPKEDALGRPKLSLQLHDFQVGGFVAIVERHGEHAAEHRVLAKINDRLKQLVLPFMTGRKTARSRSKPDAHAAMAE
jgi:hypothetical protein